LSAGLNLFQGYESTLKSLLLDSYAHIGVQAPAAAISPARNPMLPCPCSKPGRKYSAPYPASNTH
ncbi:MAG TPA: hypothetical protein PKI59_09115, partial [Candidatus Cloacimonadota bacterium]|nr:hypothetical protein [Candidatus Cloacimonadota bacterium]